MMSKTGNLLSCYVVLQTKTKGNLIKGAYNLNAAGTLVERTSRYFLLAKMDGADLRAAMEGFIRILRQVPSCISGYPLPID